FLGDERAEISGIGQCFYERVRITAPGVEVAPITVWKSLAEIADGAAQVVVQLEARHGPQSYRSNMVGSMPVVADLIVSRLRDAGVASIFGVPGGGSNLDVIAAAGRAGLPFVLTATETAGALAAAAQAEVTGRPGACLTTLGPGTASVVNGVACAFLDRAPLVVFTDSHPEMFAHQRLDHHALMAPITKWSATLAPASAAETLDRAIAIAT